MQFPQACTSISQSQNLLCLPAVRSGQMLIKRNCTMAGESAHAQWPQQPPPTGRADLCSAEPITYSRSLSPIHLGVSRPGVHLQGSACGSLPPHTLSQALHQALLGHFPALPQLVGTPRPGWQLSPSPGPDLPPPWAREAGLFQPDNI